MKRKQKKKTEQELIIKDGQYFVDIMEAGAREYTTFKVERIVIRLVNVKYEVDFRIDKNRLGALSINKSGGKDLSGIVVYPCVSNVIEIK